MDYVLRSLKNKNVFRWCLNVSNSSSGRRSPGGRVLHPRGLAEVKLRDHHVTCQRVTMSLRHTAIYNRHRTNSIVTTEFHALKQTCWEHVTTGMTGTAGYRMKPQKSTAETIGNRRRCKKSRNFLGSPVVSCGSSWSPVVSYDFHEYMWPAQFRHESSCAGR